MAPYCPQTFVAGADGGEYLLYKDIYRELPSWDPLERRTQRLVDRAGELAAITSASEWMHEARLLGGTRRGA